ncbi:MAG: hypothetical protein ACYTE5_02980 [Planctomycetota bacterium]|jgi:hypothetical protein
MSKQANVENTQQALERLVRKGLEQTTEISTVASPGARATAWAVKVKSNSSYNVYNVRAIETGQPGSLPTEIGGEMQATNLAESFLQTGQLPAGTYVVMSRVGKKNVFYAPV